MMSDGDVFVMLNSSSRHHTLLMEIYPLGIFPKRSKSIIGSTGVSNSMFWQTLLFCNTF
jgi:hypothetical protein